MGNLADFIEQYLMNILAQQPKIELKRQELAKMFRCAPSQINYVLETRFTFERGYLVESKRGEGGYIRIIQIPWQVEGSLPQIVETIIPETVTEEETETVLAELVRRGLMEAAEARLCLEVIRRNFDTLAIESSGLVRSRFIKAAVLLILSLKNR
ncbi:MAG TPA: CtsR family transcriptional regulator [Bacillota bacterium]